MMSFHFDDGWLAEVGHFQELEFQVLGFDVSDFPQHHSPHPDIGVVHFSFVAPSFQ